MNSTLTPGELRSRNLRTVLALASLFLLPLIFSFWVYYGTDWRPTGQSIHGVLIHPARPLPPLNYDGDTEEKWSLVYVGDGRCDEACKQALYVMRQTRLALAQNMSRVRRVFIGTGECCNRKEIESVHPGLVILDGSASEVTAALQQFPADERANTIFIVDPLGNLMMRYDARQNPKGLLTDLKKLLKLSHIG